MTVEIAFFGVWTLFSILTGWLLRNSRVRQQKKIIFSLNASRTFLQHKLDVRTLTVGCLNKLIEMNRPEVKGWDNLD